MQENFFITEVSAFVKRRVFINWEKKIKWEERKKNGIYKYKNIKILVFLMFLWYNVLYKIPNGRIGGKFLWIKRAIRN